MTIENKQKKTPPPHLLEAFTLHILLASSDGHSAGELRELQEGKVGIGVLWIGLMLPWCGLV